MLRNLVFALMCVLSVTLCAQGDYTLTPRIAGQDSAEVHVNDTDRTVTVDLVLDSDSTPADLHTSAIFTVEFSKPGLVYEWYEWEWPYVAGGLDEYCTPENMALPVYLGEDCWIDPISDGGLVDVYFENFVLESEDPFETGVIASVTLTVPEDFPLGDVTITCVPDTFDSGEGSIPTTGGVLTLQVKLGGDISGDGFVGQTDLDIVLDSWGQSVPPAREAADPSGDGFVGQTDLDIILDHWGDSAPSP